VSSTDEFGNTSTDDNQGAFHSFATGDQNKPAYPSTDTPVAIPDFTTVTSDIVVTDDDTVLDVEVRLNITHTYDRDLDIFLIGPDNTRVELTTDNGGSSNDFIDTIFDDEATTPITDGTAPFTGRFRPEGSLATLDGQPATGTWTLEVTDDAGVDEGELVSWDLILTYEDRPCGPFADYASHQMEIDACSTGSTGLDNNRWEVGEQVEFSLTIENRGTDPVTGAVVQVTPMTPGIVMLDDTATVGDVQPGFSATTQFPHLIAQLTDTLTCGQLVDFQLDMISSEGSWSTTFQQMVGEAVAEHSGVALSEGFATGIPDDWTVIDGDRQGIPDGFTWYADNTGDPAGCGSPDPAAPIGGTWVAVDSSCTGGGTRMDEQLITPIMNFAIASVVTLEFDHWFAANQNEIASVDVRSSATGGAWVTVAQWSGASTTNAQSEVIDISAQAGYATGVEIRWRYHDAQAELYWYVDNVVVNFYAPQDCFNEVCAAASSSPPPIPVGMTAERLLPDGTEISVDWDGQCAPTNAKIVYGPLDQVSTHTLSGSLCVISDPENWTAVPAGDLWFVLISDDGLGVESSWGLATDGERNGLIHSGTCGSTAKDITATCP
jgi:uncharacterized repeat protein (TIGR01451 family)